MEQEAVFTVSALDNTREALSRIERNLSRAGKRVGAVGKKMSAAISLPLAGLGFAALKVTASFDKSMNEVNSLLNLPQEEFNKLREQTKGLAKDIGVDLTGATQGLYSAISAGVPKENAIDFLAIASKTAIAGVTDTETAVDGLTTVLNAFKIPATDTQKVADIMFTTVKQGKTTFEELSNSMFNVAPIAATMGVRLEEVAAATATLTKSGTPTSVAMTQLRSAMTALAKPSKDMKTLLKQIGFESGDAAIKALGFQGTLRAIDKAANGNKETLGKAFGSVEALSAVLGVTGDNAKVFAEDLKAVSASAGAVEKAFEINDQGFERSMQKIKTSLVVVADTVAQALQPAMDQAVIIFGKVSEVIQGLDPQFIQIAVAIGAVVAAIGPALVLVGLAISTILKIGLALKFISGLLLKLGQLLLVVGKAMIGVLIKVAKAFFLVGKAALLTGKRIIIAMAPVLIPIAAITAAIAAVGVGLAIATGQFEDNGKAWGEGLTPVQKVMLAIRQGIHFVKIGVLAVTTGFLVFATTVVDAGRHIEDLFGRIKQGFAKMQQGILKAGAFVLETLQNMANGFISFVVSTAEKVINGIIRLSENMINGIIAGINKVNALIPGIDKINDIRFGDVNFDPGEIDSKLISKLKAQATEINTTFKAAGKSSATEFLEGLSEESAKSTVDALNNIPTASDIKVNPTLDLGGLTNGLGDKVGGFFGGLNPFSGGDEKPPELKGVETSLEGVKDLTGEAELNLKSLTDETGKSIEGVGDLGGAVGGAVKSAVIPQVKEATDSMKLLEKKTDSVAENLTRAFQNFVETGKFSFKDFANSIIQDLIRVETQARITSIFSQFKGGANAASAGGSGIVGSIIGGLKAFSFDGGGFTGNGPRTGGIDGKGGFPAIVHPNETVIDHTRGQQAGGGNITIQQTVMVRETVPNAMAEEIANAGANLAIQKIQQFKQRGGKRANAF